jgi:hypothetical protein
VTDGAETVPNRALAAIVMTAAALTVPGWLLIAVIGVGELSHTPEQGGCYQPEVLFGCLLLALALLGIVTAGWTLRAGLPVARGVGTESRYWYGAGVLIVLAIVCVMALVPLNPADEFVPGPC